MIYRNMDVQEQRRFWRNLYAKHPKCYECPVCTVSKSTANGMWIHLTVCGVSVEVRAMLLLLFIIIYIISGASMALCILYTNNVGD
jgi:hypothetical protein